MIHFFLDLSLVIQILCVYIFFINVITFIFFGLDKFKASGDFHRIRERTLWILSAIGGTIGALLAMHVFRHKTKKNSFQAVLFLILFLQIALIFFFLTVTPSSQINF